MAGVDMLLVPSLANDPMIIFNFTGHPSLTLRAGFVEVKEARSDWAPDPKHPLAKFAVPRRVPYGVTLIGKLAVVAAVVPFSLLIAVTVSDVVPIQLAPGIKVRPWSSAGVSV